MRHAPQFHLTADGVVFTIEKGILNVLLIKRGHDPFEGSWAIPGGFVEVNEKSKDAVRREFKEETGMDITDWRQLGVYDDPGRDPRGRVVSVAYYTFVPREKLRFEAHDDAAEAKLWPINSLPPLAFDHERIVNEALFRLRSSLNFFS